MFTPSKLRDAPIDFRKDSRMASFLTVNYTAAFFTSSNPILQTGEVGTETDTNKFKVGDGVSTWTELPYGFPPSYAPIIQASLDVVNTQVVQSLGITALAAVLYAVSLNMQSAGTASAGHTLTATLAWTSGIGVQTEKIVLPLDSAQIEVETFPIYCEASTAISITTAYGGGATNDAYNFSARIVQMP